MIAKVTLDIIFISLLSKFEIELPPYSFVRIILFWVVDLFGYYLYDDVWKSDQYTR